MRAFWKLFIKKSFILLLVIVSQFVRNESAVESFRRIWRSAATSSSVTQHTSSASDSCLLARPSHNRLYASCGSITKRPQSRLSKIWKTRCLDTTPKPQSLGCVKITWVDQIVAFENLQTCTNIKKYINIYSTSPMSWVHSKHCSFSTRFFALHRFL